MFILSNETAETSAFLRKSSFMRTQPTLKDKEIKKENTNTHCSWRRIRNIGETGYLVSANNDNYKEDSWTNEVKK